MDTRCEAYFLEDQSELVKRHTGSCCMSDTLKSLIPIITIVSVMSDYHKNSDGTTYYLHVPFI